MDPGTIISNIAPQESAWSRNPSDMMTKNVGQAHIDMYLDLLNLRFDIGRADIVQNLHSMGENIEQSVSTSTLLSEDLMLLRRCGNTVERAKPITSETGIPTRALRTVFANCTEAAIGQLNRLHFDSCRMPRTEKEKAEDRHVDSWSREGKDGRWTRIHRSGRRALFTPFKVAGGPNSKMPLKKIQRTRGKYFASGSSCKSIDDWTIRANAHRLLEGSWIGTTDFREVAEYIDDVSH